MKCCPTCGREFAPEIDVGGTVRQRVFDTIARHTARGGIGRRELVDAIYADDPNGGPDTDKCVTVHVYHINQLFKKRGLSLRIRSTGGIGAVYRLLKSVDGSSKYAKRG